MDNVDPSIHNPNNYDTAYTASSVASPNLNISYIQTLEGSDAYLQWIDGETDVTKEFVDAAAINVSSYNKIYVVITSVINFTMFFKILKVSKEKCLSKNTYEKRCTY